MDRLVPPPRARAPGARVARAHADPPLDGDILELSGHVAAHPEDVDALLERSELYARAGLGEDALADLRVAAALSPADPRIPLRRAGVLLAISASRAQRRHRAPHPRSRRARR